MIFGFLKLFRSFIWCTALSMNRVATQEMRSVSHAAQPKCSNKVRRLDQDDYG